MLSGSERRQGVRILLVIGVLIVSTVSTFDLQAQASTLQPRAPILIDGNAGFTDENGVTAGSGTFPDPYIIERWSIASANALGNSIEIRNTDAHFVIRNVYVQPNAVGSGILLFKVVNGTIENVTTNAYGGIAIISSENIVVSSNSLNEGGATYGVRVLSSSNVKIERNNLGPHSLAGIELQGSIDVVVSQNIMTFSGIRISGSATSHYVSHNVTPDNLLDGSPVRYHADCTGLFDFDGMPVGQLLMVNCRDVRVANIKVGNQPSPDIFFWNVSNGRVEGSTMLSSFYGRLTIVGSNNLAVTGNGFSRSSLNIVSSSSILIADNIFSLTSTSGITLDDVSGITIAHNRVNGGRIGCDGGFISGTISGNNITNSGFGIHLDYCSGNLVIKENNFVDTKAISILGNPSGPATLIFHNNFFNATVTDTGGDEAISRTPWDNGYPSGGNFWSDYAGVDVCSGPDQDVCPDSDGIGDTPRVVDPSIQNSVDRYPLMSPFHPVVPASVAFAPGVLSLRSMGKYLTAYVELPPGFDVRMIEVSSIRLNSSLSIASGAPVTMGDYDKDGVSDLMVKFEMTRVRTLLPGAGSFILQVSGIVFGSGPSPFEGSQTVRVAKS